MWGGPVIRLHERDCESAWVFGDLEDCSIPVCSWIMGASGTRPHAMSISSNCRKTAPSNRVSFSLSCSLILLFFQLICVLVS